MLHKSYLLKQQGALLQRGLTQAEYYIAPIDECYRLVGLIRANWRGLSGGSEVWAEIGRFFSDLRSHADVVDGEVDANS